MSESSDDNLLHKRELLQQLPMNCSALQNISGKSVKDGNGKSVSAHEAKTP